MNKSNLKIKTVLAIVGGLFIGMGQMHADATQGHSSNNDHGVYTVDKRATSRRFVSGEVLVKFKNSSPVTVQRVKGRYKAASLQGVNSVLAAFGTEDMEQLMPNEVPNRSLRKVRSLNGGVIEEKDLSQLFLVKAKALTPDSTLMLVDRLKALGEVEYAEPNYKVYSLATDGETGTTDCDHYKKEPIYGQQWGHDRLKLPFLWQQKKLSDKRPVIAILDTGVDITHPDLAGNIWTNSAEQEGIEEADDDNNGLADDLHGWDFVDKTGRIGDWNGHGTHCAGIAAAVGNNGVGIAGANPDALLLPITVMQSDGTGDVATIIKGIDYAIACGADVLSMSFGGYSYSIAQEQALANAYTNAVLVAAAGNDCRPINPDKSCDVCGKRGAPMFPAAFTFVLGVEASAEGGGRPGFSNYDGDGPVLSTFGEERLYNYELLAPGVDIMSTYPGGRYKALNGTSMACPFVAGAVSRLLQCKEYSSWEVLFGDLIHTRKQNGLGDVDFEAAFKLTDADRQPSLGLVTYVMNDSVGGDADLRPDAGETIALYPTLRNEWGQAENIRFWLEMGENEDMQIVELLDGQVDFGKQLSGYGKNVSANPVRFKVSDDCVDGRKIRMVLKATCDNIAEELTKEFTITVENGVEIGGLIAEDMTLYPDVHYIVTQTLAVPEGVTLTIKPGTVLKFKDNVGMNISKGSLKCVGTPDSMIVFTMADQGAVGRIDINDEIEYVKFSEMYIGYVPGANIALSVNAKMTNCVIENCYSQGTILYRAHFEKVNFLGSQAETFLIKEVSDTKYSNIVGNVINDRIDIIDNWSGDGHKNSNVFGNIGEKTGNFYNIAYYSYNPKSYTPEYPNYLGSAREDIIRKGLVDMYHTSLPIGFGVYDLSNTLTRPSAEAHGIVWKVVVNGYDAQDEFEQLPPLGVGKHKFEVYFNRPMDVSVAPTMAMGVRPPYTQNVIAEEGSWSADSLVYTAYLTIDGKTGADGLNRIYVSGARDNEYFDIPIEKSRFNVQVESAGSMATGLMAEAGMGKVSLTWQTDEEDFEDLLGYNIYRYTVDSLGVSSDSIIINESVLEADETEFVDYDVVPRTTYYYVIKQLTTSLNAHSLSNAVAATPLTSSKGDANGSGDVDVADVITTVNYAAGQQPQLFIYEAADMNSDEMIDILDVIGIIKTIVNPEAQLTSMAEAEAVYTVEDGVVYVETPVALAGVQVQLLMPEKKDISVADDLKGFENVSAWLSDNDYIFLAYNMNGKTLAPGKHALLTIGDARISGIRLSDAMGRNVMPVSGQATSISNMGATVKTIKGVYNLKGQRVAASADKLKALPKGVYIVDGEKVIK